MPADTYSNALGALLMGTGNDNNTWGSNANSSVFQIFEDAIANTLTSTVTGGTLDLSGTPPPAGPSQVRYAALVFNGLLTSNQVVKVPNLTKWWWVNNAFTLTIQTPTASAVATIPQTSNWVLVTCDGSNNVTPAPFSITPAWYNVNAYAGSLQAAVNAAGAAGGGVVYIPGGTTVALGGTPVTMPSSGNVWIVGDGWSSIITQTAGAIAINNTTGAGGSGGFGSNNNAFVNFAIEYTAQGTGPGGNTPTTGGIGIFNSTGWPATMFGLKITNAYIGILCGGNPSTAGNIAIIDGCWIWDATFAGVFLYDATNVQVTNTRVLASGANLNIAFSAACFYLWGSNAGHVFENSSAYGAAGRGLWARTSSGGAPSTNFSYSSITDCYFDSAALDGMWIDFPSLITIRGCEFSSGRGNAQNVNYTGGHGFVCGGGASQGDSNTIVGNYFVGCGNSGLVLGSGHTTVTGNIAAGNNVNNSGSSGIVVDANVSDFTLTGNICGSSQATGAFFGIQVYAIVVGAGSGTRYSIANNMLSGTTTNDAVNDQGTLYGPGAGVSTSGKFIGQNF
jgi:hypothetical protein